jgi:hypothetical protein
MVDPIDRFLVFRLARFVEHIDFSASSAMPKGSAARRGTPMRAFFAAISNIMSGWGAERTTVATAAPLAGPARLAVDSQMDRLAAVLGSAQERTRAIASAHAMAREKLQAADYALDRLFDELHAVMPKTNRAKLAPVAVIVPAPIDIRRRRLAA